jgi:membrane-associated phospholipid phosphatase
MKKLAGYILGQISAKVIVISVLFLISILIFGFLAHEIVAENESGFDSKVFAFFKARTTPGLVEAMKILTFFGTSTFFLPAYFVLIGLLWYKRRRIDAINIAVIAITSTLLMFGLKNYFHRQRPSLPLLKTVHNFSFPSGHALCSFIFCSVLIYLVWKGNWSKTWKWVTAILLVLFAISIGISRIILRYHYASDVLAGICLGFAWVVIALWVEQKLTPAHVERQLNAA